MEKLAKTDLATGLYNHKAFYEHLEKLLNDYEKGHFEFHLALFDLDKFKSVNDTYGHAVGDIVIANSAKFIKENLRAKDFAARYGGEEFAVIFCGRGVEEVKATLENIRQKMEETLYKEMGDKNVTVSIGFVSIGECINKKNIFKIADKRLYKAKSQGRNRIISED
jgi:two-component system cell cycle response regulator